MKIETVADYGISHFVKLFFCSISPSGKLYTHISFSGRQQFYHCNLRNCIVPIETNDTIISALSFVRRRNSILRNLKRRLRLLQCDLETRRLFLGNMGAASKFVDKTLFST